MLHSDLPLYEHYVAVDNYCAWPNLTLLPDGSVGAMIFNRPSHGGVEGDIELWVSPDGRAPWTRRSTVSAHAPGTVRMNLAAGAGKDGVLVALVGGWHIGQPQPIRTDNILLPSVCRSFDAGYTWERSDTFQPPAEHRDTCVFQLLQEARERGASAVDLEVVDQVADAVRAQVAALSKPKSGDF